MEQTTELATQQNASIVSFDTAEGRKSIKEFAELFAKSDLVPDTFKGKPGNCFIAVEMAFRMKASPLAVMQNLYVVHGKPGWSAQFLIASFNQCGRFGPMHYEFFGEKGTLNWGCFAWAIDKETGERVEGPPVTLQMAKDEGWSTKNGSKWKNLPQLMLQYRAGTFLQRTTAPELSMGLPSKDEIEDVGPRRSDSEGSEQLKRLVLGKAIPTPALEQPQGNQALDELLMRLEDSGVSIPDAEIFLGVTKDAWTESNIGDLSEAVARVEAGFAKEEVFA